MENKHEPKEIFLEPAGHYPLPELPKSSQLQERETGFKSFFGKKIRVAVLAGMYFVGLVRPAEAVSKHKQPAEKSLGLDFFITSSGQNAQGNDYTMWPQVALIWKRSADKVSPKIEIEIPMEFAQNFDAANPVNLEDLDKAGALIRQQLMQKLAHLLTDYSFGGKGQDIYRTKNRGEVLGGLKVTAIKIKGFASPEGPEQTGPASILTGHIEPENIALAKLRAGLGEKLVIEQLAAMGLSEEELSKLTEVRYEELQFTSRDQPAIKKALSLATEKFGLTGNSEEEKLWNLIISYNNGEIDPKDPGNAELLKNIQSFLDSKRMIKLSLDFEGGQRKDVVIAFPLLPFLLLPGLAAAGWAAHRALRNRNKQTGKEQKDNSVFLQDQVASRTTTEYLGGGRFKKVTASPSSYIKIGGIKYSPSEISANDHLYVIWQIKEIGTLPAVRTMYKALIAENPRNEILFGEPHLFGELYLTGRGPQYDSITWGKVPFSPEDQQKLMEIFEKYQAVGQSPEEKLLYMMRWYEQVEQLLDDQRQYALPNKTLETYRSLTADLHKIFKGKLRLAMTMTLKDGRPPKTAKVEAPLLLALSTINFYKKSNKQN